MYLRQYTLQILKFSLDYVSEFFKFVIIFFYFFTFLLVFECSHFSTLYLILDILSSGWSNLLAMLSTMLYFNFLFLFPPSFFFKILISLLNVSDFHIQVLNWLSFLINSLFNFFWGHQSFQKLDYLNVWYSNHFSIFCVLIWGHCNLIYESSCLDFFFLYLLLPVKW